MCSSRHLIVLTALLISACAGGQSKLLRQHLDERTALMYTGLKAPLVLYQDEPQLGANAREYVQIAPLEINRQGNLRYFLWMGIWSTIDRGDAADRRSALERVHLFADGEPMDLELAAWNLPGQPGEVQFYDTPVETAVVALYAVTLDQLRKIATTKEIYLVAGVQSHGRYEAWEWNPNALTAFVDYASDREIR